MSPAGEAQVRELAARLRLRAIPDAIYCSDLSRSLRTAELLADESVIPIPRSPRRCVKSRWAIGKACRGAKSPNAGLKTTRARGPPTIANFRPPGGESFADLVRGACCRAGANSSKTARRKSSRSPVQAGVNRVIFVICSSPARQSVPNCAASGLRQCRRVRKNEPVVTLIDGERL